MRRSLTFLFCLFLLGACSASKEKSPNVLLVVVDTLRQDHLGGYGYGQNPTSPFLDNFSQESVVLNGLTASSSWTLPSMATLFTGLEPAEHGVMRMTGNDSRLGDVETLATRFQDAGYATGCVMGNFLMTRRRGGNFDRGFSSWDDSAVDLVNPHRGSSAGHIVEQAKLWLRARSNDEPWFLVLHFFDPHASYEDHPSWDFQDPTYSGWVKGGLGVGEYRRMVGQSDAADFKALSALYDEEIREVDTAFGSLVEEIETRKDWERTLVTFTSDHGEELGERGWIGHTRTLYGELVDIPCIVRLPGGARGGERVQARLPLSGLHATLLDLCGISVPPGLSASFAPVLKGGEVKKRPVFCEVDFQPILEGREEKRVRKRAAFYDDYKLIKDVATGESLLFWLGGDPDEQENVYRRMERLGAQARLEELMRNHSWWTAE